MSLKEPHHIIVIGASAGGVEEINTFFDHTPIDGISYVIVQHLSADFKSRMVELLGKHSKLVVTEAKEGMPILSNQVYLIPSDKFMTVGDNKLHLTSKTDEKGPYLTINKFFISLAKECGEKAIAVLLSGMGADGSEGIREIKKAGGMVIVRNPDTSGFPSMPSNAIATGMVDFILEPELMPATIEEFLKQEDGVQENDADAESKRDAIIEIINIHSPLDFSEYKKSTILRRIRRRAESLQFKELDAYIEFLRVSPDEVDALTKDFLISVTSFFRDKKAFDFIAATVLPDLLKTLTQDEELKVWVTGCATGEEAYSLAIIIDEQLKASGNRSRTVKIFATDIDANAILHAGKGIYSRSIAKHILPERLENYFTIDGDHYKVSTAIRSMVIFAHHDIVKNPPYCNMHFISCRNLLIYMTPILQKKIFSMLLFGLKKGGYLFLGSSENPSTIIDNLETIHKKYKIYRNLETKRFVRFDAFSLPVIQDKKQVANNDIAKRIEKPLNNLEKYICEAVLSNFNQAIICIDENKKVIRSFGDTSPFLVQKNFNPNLPESMGKSLGIAFNNLFTEVIKTGTAATTHHINISKGAANLIVDLKVEPVAEKFDKQKIFLVTITQNRTIIPGGASTEIFDEKESLNVYLKNMEEDSRDLKEKLENAYLQLDATNENMQSFNEELLSANEEMQSTNEEMQSVNEELHTINSEYQLKNKELLELNDDLNNYFRSSMNGQLFVNNELVLMKFTPGTVKQINLLPTDIGRPLSNISTNIKFESLIEDIKEVIKNGSNITKEIQTINEKWYQVVTVPYVQQLGNKNTGAIVTFNDITELKKIQIELDNKNKSLQRINEDLDNFVHTTSHDLLGPLGTIEVTINVMNSIKVPDPDLKEFLDIIDSSMKKFRKLITDIATIGKLEDEMSTHEMVDLDELLDDIQWSLENKIRENGALIKRNLEVKKVFFSKKNLRSILYNLISNGIKFRKEDMPVIYIETIRNRENTIFIVQDNGLGIRKDDMDNLFIKYHRLNDHIEGHGIGLYLARKIINASGGSLSIESKVGVGTKFTITIPTKQGKVIS